MTKQRRCPAITLGPPSTLFYPRASGLPNGFSVKEARHARKTTTPQVPPWESPPRRRRVCRQCSPFQPRPPKRRRGILGGRIGEHFPLQRLEISRSIVCFRITQLDLDGSPAPVVLNDQIDLKALLISEIMDTVVDTARRWKGTLERGPSSARADSPSVAQARPKAQGL